MTFGKKTYKGRFQPKNPKKYNGDADNIIYRSTWEVRVMKWLDEHPNVIWWASEELPIPYKSPLDNRMHRYFPDFIAKIKQKDGSVMTYIIEVKPLEQTKMPVQKKKTQRYIREAATYVVNQEKWKAADIFCQEHGWKFMIMTEKELGI
jgi:Lhr-like helicase